MPGKPWACSARNCVETRDVMTGWAALYWDAVMGKEHVYSALGIC